MVLSGPCWAQPGVFCRGLLCLQSSVTLACGSLLGHLCLVSASGRLWPRRGHPGALFLQRPGAAPGGRAPVLPQALGGVRRWRRHIRAFRLLEALESQSRSQWPWLVWSHLLLLPDSVSGDGAFPRVPQVGARLLVGVSSDPCRLCGVGCALSVFTYRAVDLGPLPFFDESS